MHINAIVPKNPLRLSNNGSFPQGFIFLFFIIKEVINKLKTDLKKTNSKIGILSSIFFTHIVIILKNKEANTKLNPLKIFLSRTDFMKLFIKVVLL